MQLIHYYIFNKKTRPRVESASIQGGCRGGGYCQLGLDGLRVQKVTLRAESIGVKIEQGKS